MDARERVLLVLEHREPDRVPIGIGASGSAIHDSVYLALKARLNIVGEIEPFRRGHGDNYYDDRVFDALGSDIRHVYLNFYRCSHFVRQELGAGGLYDPFVDAWGLVRETKAGLHAFGGNPLARATTASDIDGYPWPNPYGDSGLLEGVRQRAEYLRHQTGFAISTRCPTSGIFEYCWVLRGMENFMVDMLTDPKLATRLIDRVTDAVMKYYDILLGAVGPLVDIVETQDDYGTQQNSFMSPELFRKMIKPARQRLHELIRARAPQARIYLHTCGSVRNLIPDLIEVGVDILNPIQPLAAGMEPAALKADFGEKLTFHGAIDMQQAMPGSLEDVSREVRLRIRQLAPGGGYILAPANLVQRDVPLDNLLRMVEDTIHYGKYPIEQVGFC